MRISVTGFARDRGLTRLFDHEVRHANTDHPAELPRHERLKMYVTPHKHIVLEAFTNTRLNGDYRLRVTVMSEDTLHLFLECYPELRNALENLLTQQTPPAPSKQAAVE